MSGDNQQEINEKSLPRKRKGAIISRRFVLPLLLGVSILLCAFFTRIYTAMPWQEETLFGIPVFQWKQSVAVGFFAASAWGATLAVGCVFWALLTPLTGAYWTGRVRKVWLLLSESGMGAWIFLFCVVGSMGTILFPWMGELRRCPAALLWEWGGDPLVQSLHHQGAAVLAERAWFVNMPFFFTREFFYGILLVLIPSIWMNCFERVGVDSLTNERNGKVKRVCSALALPLVIVSIGMMGIDWTNAKGTEWIPSLFPIAFLASAAVLGLASSCCFAPAWKHDEKTVPRLGALLLTGLMFKLYLWYSLYMLVWYAKLPEEAAFFSVRLLGEWGSIASFCSIGSIAILLLLLVPRIRRSGSMLGVCGVMLTLMGAMEVYWLIAPAMGVKSPGGMCGWCFAVSWVVVVFFMLLSFISSRRLSILSDRAHHQPDDRHGR